MPLIGTMDITMGVLALVSPCRALFIWAAVWCTWTALLRPLAGEPVWELVERAGNYGVPLALLAVVGWRGFLFVRLPARWPPLSPATFNRLAWTLRLTTATLLAGHAGLGLFVHKAGLAHHYASFWPSGASALVPWIGAFEFLLAAMVLTLSGPAVLIGVCGWKIACELLFPMTGAPWWEFVERFGSYTAPLSLAWLLVRGQTSPAQETYPTPGYHTNRT